MSISRRSRRFVPAMAPLETRLPLAEADAPIDDGYASMALYSANAETEERFDLLDSIRGWTVGDTPPPAIEPTGTMQEITPDPGPDWVGSADGGGNW